MGNAQPADELDRLRRVAKTINVIAWGVVALIMFYGVPIVYGYLSRHGVPKETAWMLSLAVDGALAVGLVATPVLAEYGIKGGWVGALRWVAGLATWALNTAESWAGGVPVEGAAPAGGPDWGGVFSHSWGPLMMFFAVEGAAYFQRKIADVIRRKEAEAVKRADDIAEMRARAAEAVRKQAEAEERLRAEQRKRADAEAAAAAEAEARAQAEAVAADIRQQFAHHNAKLEQVQVSAREARRQAADASDQAARTAGQLDEARAIAERAIADKLAAEQHAAAVAASREAVAEELARVRQAYDRLSRRQEVPAQRRAETGSSSGRRAAGKPKAVPAVGSGVVPAGTPEVPGVSPATVAAVVAAMRMEPGASQGRLMAITKISDRTIRKVQKALPASALTADDADAEEPEPVAVA